MRFGTAVIGVVLLAIGAGFLWAYALMTMWNWAIPAVFGSLVDKGFLPGALSYWDALKLAAFLWVVSFRHHQFKGSA